MSTGRPTDLQRRKVMSAMASAALGAGLGWQPVMAAPAPEAAPPKLRLAVVPQLTPVEMTACWSPVVDALTSQDIACELVVYPSIAKFEPEFLTGRADIAFLNPYHMVMARRAQHYEPLLRDARPLQGVLVVKKDSPVHSMEQLKDHRISFPAPNAFAASLYVRSALERQYKLSYETHYAQNHRNAIRQVLAGDSAAAGVVRTTLEKEPLEVQQGLRILYATPDLSPHPIAVHPRVPMSVRKKLTDALLALASHPQTQALMAGIQMPNPQIAVYAKDYAPLEKLKIEKYVVID